MVRGRREGQQEGESAFLLLEDQNQKYSSWKRAEGPTGSKPARLCGAKRANPKILPAFPPSCGFLLHSALLGAEQPIAGVAQAGQDVAVLVESFVDGGREHRYVGVRFRQIG